MATSLTAPSHYLNRCWLSTIMVQWIWSSGIHMRTVSQDIPQPLTTKISLKITHLKFTLNLPGANELSIEHMRACLKWAVPCQGELSPLYEYFALGHKLYALIHRQVTKKGYLKSLAHKLSTTQSFESYEPLAQVAIHSKTLLNMATAVPAVSGTPHLQFVSPSLQATGLDTRASRVNALHSLCRHVMEYSIEL